VTKGQAVTLYVSTGPKLVTVPTVKTKPVQTAETTLKNAVLKFTPVQVPSTRPSGTVVGQTPVPGHRVKVGTKVTLKVSNQSTVTVPNVVGQTQSKAGGIIAGDSLTVGNAVSHCSNTFPTGIVSAQTPPQGKQVAPKTTVTITVSTGACTATVPNVVGQTSNAAGTILHKAGFANVVTDTTTSCKATTNGKVTSQTPTGGTTLATTKPVTVSVCSVPTPTSTTTTSNPVPGSKTGAVLGPTPATPTPTRASKAGH
jgi:serine/threonine-protein kinase